jgi:hypothetical protein
MGVLLAVNGGLKSDLRRRSMPHRITAVCDAEWRLGLRLRIRDAVLSLSLREDFAKQSCSASNTTGFEVRTRGAHDLRRSTVSLRDRSIRLTLRQPMAGTDEEARRLARFVSFDCIKKTGGTSELLALHGTSRLFHLT